MDTPELNKIFCETCGIDLATPVVALQHFWGARHCKQVWKYRGKPQIFIPGINL